ncbi:MAG: hypothetical protein RMJ34_07600, partial [candidate division WOR-3 bacterium]|nr:hypothetical protein [candidate division WOR-3 bacterium]
IIDATKAILHSDRNVKLAQYPFYLVYARELYRLKNKFASRTLWNNLIILREKWISWGLEPQILYRIEREVFGLVPTPPLGESGQPTTTH